MKTIDEIRQENITLLAKELGGVGALASRIDRSSSQVSQWVTGAKHSSSGKPRRLSSDSARYIEMRCQKSMGWLDQPRSVQEVTAKYSNTSPIDGLLNSVPVISWVQAGQWSEIIDSHHPGDGEAFVSAPGRVGKHGFALRVEGDSMMNSGAGDSFPPGITIIVDPDVQAKTGSYVVVRLDNEDQATFKQLIIDGGKRYLKPLNDRYPLMEITAPATICGVVVASFKRHV